MIFSCHFEILATRHLRWKLSAAAKPSTTGLNKRNEATEEGGEGLNHRGHRGHRGKTVGISLCPLCPLWLVLLHSLPLLWFRLGRAVASFFLLSVFIQLPAGEAALPPAVPPANEKVTAAWLMPLLSVSRELARTRPEVVDADISRNSAALSTRVARSQWNPRASLSPSYGEGRSQSNSVVDGPGIIRAQNGSTSLSLSQPFSTGTAVSLSGASSASRSNGAGVISDSF